MRRESEQQRTTQIKWSLVINGYFGVESVSVYKFQMVMALIASNEIMACFRARFWMCRNHHSFQNSDFVRRIDIF